MCQIFPLAFEIGKEYASLSEKNGCFSACILALFQLHALHWMLHTSTLLSEFKGWETKDALLFLGCGSLGGSTSDDPDMQGPLSCCTTPLLQHQDCS